MLDLDGALLDQDSVSAVGTPDAPVFIIDLDWFLAADASVSHSRLRHHHVALSLLDRAFHRPCDGRSDRCIWYVCTACKGVPAFNASPDTGTNTSYRRKTTLNAFVLVMRLLLDVGDFFSDVTTITHAEST